MNDRSAEWTDPRGARREWQLRVGSRRSLPFGLIRCTGQRYRTASGGDWSSADLRRTKNSWVEGPRNWLVPIGGIEPSDCSPTPLQVSGFVAGDSRKVVLDIEPRHLAFYASMPSGCEVLWVVQARGHHYQKLRRLRSIIPNEQT